MAAGVLGSVLIGCVKSRLRVESQARMADLQGDGLEFTQKNQKADPQATQSTADCANGSQLDMGTRFYV